MPRAAIRCCLVILAWAVAGSAQAEPTRQTALYQRIKAHLNQVRAIDTHDHLFPFDKLPAAVDTEQGKQVNLAGLWLNSYFRVMNPLPVWQTGQQFDDWWQRAQPNFDNARSMSVYRYLLPAFQDLYGVDFNTLTLEHARALNEQVIKNYRNEDWIYHVVTQRANIEVMFNDQNWARFEFKTDYDFTVQVMNTNTLIDGFHPSEFKIATSDPYEFARRQQLPLETLDDYVRVIDRLVADAKERGVICLKSTLAYTRTLHYEAATREQAQAAFGKPREELSTAQIKTFQDYIMGKLAKTAARHNLPFQFHTGWGRVQGSNPLLLVDLIESNPNTKFLLFHSGYPWVGESAVIAARHRNVWLDSNWLPTLNYSMAKRAYHEWLDGVPSNKIMWGGDCNNAEGIYGATETTRRCLAEVLAEKVDRGDLLEAQALKIGEQILRENALALFPQLKARVKPPASEANDARKQ
ncbi:MAG: amidohydrolase family protein [Planctomycetes bacterium]|nr:amidohydrolase family protein [Planctomycetota bacterium]